MVLKIRDASIDDAPDFVKLMIMSAPELKQLFPNTENLLKHLFKKKKNLFSYEKTSIVDDDGKVAGLMLSYDWGYKMMNELRTGLLIMFYLGFKFFSAIPKLMQAKNRVGWILNGEYYLSNLAIYPEYRGKGFGSMMMQTEFLKAGNLKVVLDVDKDNSEAISLYEKLGFITIKEFIFCGKKFLRMKKGGASRQ